nr:hypothetical protein [Cyanidiaceae sp.]
MDLTIIVASFLLTVLILFLDPQDNSASAEMNNQKNLIDLKGNNLVIKWVIWFLLLTLMGLLLIKAKIQ